IARATWIALRRLALRPCATRRRPSGGVTVARPVIAGVAQGLSGRLRIGTRVNGASRDGEEEERKKSHRRPFWVPVDPAPLQEQRIDHIVFYPPPFRYILYVVEMIH